MDGCFIAILVKWWFCDVTIY